MKNKILFGTMLALLLVGSVSFADDDADKKRLLEEYDRMQEEKAKAQPEMTEVVGENGEVVVTEGEEVAMAPKKSEKDMKELKEKIAEGYFGKVIRAKGIIPSDSSENSENFKYWHFDNNLSSFNFNKMKMENLPNFDSDDKSGNVILIGNNLKRNKIEKYFLK